MDPHFASCIVVQVDRFRPGQIVDVTNVRRRVVEDSRDGARDVHRRDRPQRQRQLVGGAHTSQRRKVGKDFDVESRRHPSVRDLIRARKAA
jgi:hypothetical protein